ncbi:hypothetical protein EDD16DRAFT_393229 [Pisolithus croceorrhizus]|nr:hypothetical protein EDD16DRAFT_393229 [Pisolithus croceorrhizus]KAI6114667.1 hypothetical protein EV401DRAFT_130733 [Pisolithus croceorrhizus]
MIFFTKGFCHKSSYVCKHLPSLTTRAFWSLSLLLVQLAFICSYPHAARRYSFLARFRWTRGTFEATNHRVSGVMRFGYSIAIGGPYCPRLYGLVAYYRLLQRNGTLNSCRGTRMNVSECVLTHTDNTLPSRKIRGRNTNLRTSLSAVLQLSKPSL